MVALVENMFSVKERPWHKLGTVLEEAPSIQEGIKLAGLDWKVSLRPIISNDDDQVKIDSHKIIVREDNKTPLGIVGKSYQPLQNEDAFNWFEPFVDNGLATLETAGSLLNGKRVFILAKIKSDDMEIQKNDIVEKYILLSNAHDGGQALRVGYTPIRVVCNNTLTAAIKSKQSQLIRLTHKGDIVNNLNDLRETFDLINQQFITTEEKYKELVKKDINSNDLKKYVRQVFSSRKLEDLINNYEEKEQIEAERKRLLARVEEIFDLEPVHNGWTMYNSVNYYLNHERGKDLEKRYNSMWFGVNKSLDNRALALALAI